MNKVALIGLGKWGSNILRELANLGLDVSVILNNKSEEKEVWIKNTYPNFDFTYNKEDIKDNDSIQHIFIATPMSTHFDLAGEFIGSGKKVFLEKPITLHSTDADNLINLAETRNSQFMVGHIFLYHPCFLMLRDHLNEKRVVKVSINKTSRNSDVPHSSNELFLDSFVHETSILIKLFGVPAMSIYDKELSTLKLKFKDFIASVQIKQPDKNEKIRMFEFSTNVGVYRWKNDDLFDPEEVKICSPEKSVLLTELNIFVNEYAKWEKEIKENNKIAVESVKLLNTLWKN